MNDRAVVLAAALAAAVAFVGPPVPVVAAVVFLMLAALTRRPVPVVIAVAVLVGARAHQAVDALDRPLPGRLSGPAELVGDPQPGRFGTQVEVRMAGRRWLTDVARADEWVIRPLLTGDRVVLVAQPRPFRNVPRAWQLSRHLAGRLDVSAISRGPPAAPWFGLANGVHRLLAAGSVSFGPQRQALFMGLVLGDDRAQSDLERFRFRATGLGHLLAVSGQNVAFLMALATPLLGRCGTRTRWVLGAVVLVVFVLVTRAEASVLRAVGMAAVALTASSMGRVASGARILGVAVVGLLVLDPLLVHSTGFRLSVSATAGLLVGVRPLARRLPGPRWLVQPFATTLAAQIATAPLLIGLAGGVPAVATVANLFAVPAAGLVMMLGLSTGLVAGSLSAPVAVLVNWPSGVLVGWVDGVARIGSLVPLPMLGPDRLLVIGAAVLAARWVGRRLPRTGACVAVGMVVLALMPSSPPSGRYRPSPGVVVDVGTCGERWVSLQGAGAGADAVEVLEGLRDIGIVRAAVVLGAGGVRPVAAQVAEQLRADLRPAAPSGGPCTVTR